MKTSASGNRLAQLFPATLADVDSLVDHFFAGEARQASFRAPASFWEADNQLHVELDVPGVKLDDVDITFDKGNLLIAVERKVPEGERKVWHDERRFGKVTRSLSLPDTADPESISASLNNGVLHITIGKHPEAQPKKIEVKND